MRCHIAFRVPRVLAVPGGFHFAHQRPSTRATGNGAFPLPASKRLVLAEILRQVDRISEARRERRVMADGIVPAILPGNRLCRVLGACSLSI